MHERLVAFMLTGATAITSCIAVLRYRQAFFTRSAQLARRAPVE